MFSLITNPRYGLSYRPWRNTLNMLREFPFENVESNWTPDSDVTESDTHYVITLEVPGIDMKKTDISYSNGYLSVRGEKTNEMEKGESCLCSERFSGSFSREFKLGAKINEDKIDATYRDGVLKIVLPKAEVAQSKRIVVH